MLYDCLLHRGMSTVVLCLACATLPFFTNVINLYIQNEYLNENIEQLHPKWSPNVLRNI